MITAVRIFDVDQDKVGIATEYLKRVKEKFDEVAPNKTRRLKRSLTGDTGRLLLVLDLDSLAAFDETRKKLSADPGVEKLLKENSEKHYFRSSHLVIDEEVT